MIEHKNASHSDSEDKINCRSYPNGVTTVYDYDNMDRLTRLKDVGPAATLFDRQYGYNTANQIQTITEPANNRTFGYDLVDRLRTVTASNNQNENYLFDKVGNRTSSHRSTVYGDQPFNKLTSTDTATYNYDASGNMIQKSEGLNFWRYTWDYENRMGSAAIRKQIVRYKYDALGRRVQRVLGFGRENTKFTYDGQDVLVDDDSGTLIKYLNGDGIDNKLRQTTGSNTNYFLSDHLGSTNGLIDGSGALAASNGYDSFGNSSNTSFPTRYQFTGREYDNFTGLQYSRARWYDANLGRFISEDPIGFAGGINPYAYVSNNPLAFTDSFGLDAEWDRQKWRAQQDLIEAAAPAIEFGIGFGDTILMGGSKYFRQWQGIDDPNLACSVNYQAGEWTAIAFQAAEGGVGLYRGGLALATRAGGARVFWSGDKAAMNAATNFAKSTGGSTLEMTAGGRAMTAANPWLPRWASNPIWTDLSASFARGARGSADAFHYSGGIRTASTWARTEYPILNGNGVTIFYHTVFP